MSIKYNGTTIPETGTIKYGNTILDKVIYNNTTVWSKGMSLLSTTYFTADSYVSVSSSAVKVSHKGGEGVTITKYSKYFTNNFKKLDVGGDYYIATDSSVTSYMTVTLEDSNGTVINTILHQTIVGDSTSRTDTFSKTVNLESYVGKSLRFKFVLYHRYMFQDYVNITKLRLHN